MRLKASRLSILVIIAAVVASGCATMKRQAHHIAEVLKIEQHVAPLPVPKDAPGDYKIAYSALQEEKFNEAAAKFEDFLRENPVTPWTQAAKLNLGRAYEGLEHWQQAAETYRSIVPATESAPKLQAMALYRLSFCLEALGEEQQVVAVLNDLFARARYLPDEIGKAELPARLGGAYARVGNFDRAVEFYQLAESGIARLRRDENGKIPDWLPRTLFFMGEMSHRQVDWTSFEKALRPLTRSQIYLMQAAELEQTPWAEKASGELISTYRDLVQVIETAPTPDGDPLLAERQKQRNQWDKAVLLLDVMAELRARAVPKVSSKSKSVAAVLEALDAVEKRIQNLLMERPKGEGLTAEAQARRSPGMSHVIEPDRSLEERFIKSSHEVPPLKIPAKSEDPNL